jgi:hypothetical protein
MIMYSNRKGGFFSEVLVVIGVVDGHPWVDDCQGLGTEEVTRRGVCGVGKVGIHVDKRTGLGTGTQVGGIPEAIAEEDPSGYVEIW